MLSDVQRTRKQKGSKVCSIHYIHDHYPICFFSVYHIYNYTLTEFECLCTRDQGSKTKSKWKEESESFGPFCFMNSPAISISVCFLYENYRLKWWFYMSLQPQHAQYFVSQIGKTCNYFLIQLNSLVHVTLLSIEGCIGSVSTQL